MTPEVFVKLRPELFHIAHGGACATIRRLGLLSTSALLDLHGVTGAEREALEQHRRATSHSLRHSDHGLAILRDQRPLSEAALARQLTDGWTPADWLINLNRMVFLFPTRKNALKFADVYAHQENDLLTFSTHEILAQAGDRVRLCKLNSGAPTLRSPTVRGPSTFRRLEAFDLLPSRVREVAIEERLTDIDRLLLRVERINMGCAPVEIWKR